MKRLARLLCALAAALPFLHGAPAGAVALFPAGATTARSLEVRGGILLHDRKAFVPRKESGEDLNFETVFPSPRIRFLQALRSPRPHVGASVNERGGTNRFYAGLTWTVAEAGSLFLDGSLGLAWHDGERSGERPGRESLGTAVLFRESVELGAGFRSRHAFSLLLDHCSNANLARPNDGLTDVGIRYRYRF